VTDIFANLTLTFEGAVARLTLARPDKLNPLDWATVKELRTAIAAIDSRPEIGFVVVTGQGRSFSAARSSRVMPAFLSNLCISRMAAS